MTTPTCQILESGIQTVSHCMPENMIEVLYSHDWVRESDNDLRMDMKMMIKVRAYLRIFMQSSSLTTTILQGCSVKRG